MSLPAHYTNFSGGFNSLSAPYNLNDSQARDLTNVQGTTAGAIVKRNGLSTFKSVAGVFTSLAAIEDLASGAPAPSVLFGSTGTSLYDIRLDGTIDTRRTGMTAGTRWEFVNAKPIGLQGPLYGMNGTDTPQQWDGVQANASDWTAAHGTVPNGKYCVYHQNQVFVAGVTANPSRVYWSAIADPTDWDPSNLAGAGFEDFDPDDGQAITGLGTVGPYLLVCKRRKLWVLVDPATAQTRQISDNVGCVAHRTIASGPSGTYFLAEDRGVYRTNGSSLTPISDNIQPTIDAISPGLRSQACGAVFDAHYYLSVPLNSTTNDTTLDYDEKLNSWWKHSFGSNQFAVWHQAGVPQLYSAKSTAAIVDQCFAPGVYQDNGSNFTWTWKGPWQSPSFYRRRLMPTPYYRKRLRQVRADGTGVADFSIAKDFSGGELAWAQDIFGHAGTSTFGGDGNFGGSGIFGDPPVQQARFFSLGVGKAFSIVFSATSDQPGAVYSYTMFLADRKDQTF